MAHCRSGSLGFNRAQCESCKKSQWYASSCGDRHCPNCLGPRQAQWAHKVCQRLPDCPHFHVVFTIPRELHAFFEHNYRVAASLLFGAAAETIKSFQKRHWKMDGGFFAVLHTWGSALNWHPHLHVLCGSGGVDRETGRWREARKDYFFPVKAMSKVFGAIMLRDLEALDGDTSIRWPEEIRSVEQRRDWRLRLCHKSWNIFTRPSLNNTRAVVRYLARYTTRIAMSNQRIKHVDEVERTVSFEWKNYRQGGRKSLSTLSGKKFIRRFTRHLVPCGLRRVRYYGLLAGKSRRFRDFEDNPRQTISERDTGTCSPECPHCGCRNWSYHVFFQHLPESPATPINKGGRSKSLVSATGAGPPGFNKRMKPTSLPEALLT